MRRLAPIPADDPDAAAARSHVPLDAGHERVALIGAGSVGLSILLACCVLWFVLDPMKYALVEAQRQGVPLGDAGRRALAGLPVASWLLVGIAGAAAVSTLVLEVRSRAISAAVGGSSRLASGLVLVAVLLWFGHAYLYGGQLLGGDTGAHIARVAHFADGLRQGELRYWDNAFYGGATFLQFTGPLFFWLAGAAAWLVGDPVVATKLVLLGLHFAGGWAVYRLLRGFELSRPAATVGSIIYAGAFAHLHLMLFKGALPQAITLALLPVIFIAADRLAVASRHLGPAWAAMALGVAALVVAHQPHGLISGLYLACYVAANLVFGRYPFAAVWRFVSAAVVAGLLASFAVVPWLVEGGAVIGSAETVPLFWEWPGIEYFAKLLVWGNQWTSEGAASVAYVGLTSAALAVIALAGICLGRTAQWTRLLVGVVFVLLLISFALRADFLRDIIFTLFFFAVLAAFGAERLIGWKRGAPGLALAILLLVLADLGATAVQPLARRDKDYLDAAGAYLAAPGEGRVALMHDYSGAGDPGSLVADIGPAAGPISYYPVQTLSGPHNMAATSLHNYAIAALKRVERDLRRDAMLSPGTIQLLAMLNVGRVINDNGTGMGLPPGIPGTVHEGPLGLVLPIADATAAVYAPALAEVAPPEDADRPALWETSFDPQLDSRARAVDAVLDEVISTMRFAAAERSAASIPIRPGQPQAIAAPGSAPPASAAAPALTVLDYAVEAQRVEMTLRLSAPGFVQLAHPWYPFQSIEVDGQPVHALRGTLNLLVLPMDAGDHVIEVKAERSALRQAFGVGCGLLLAAVIAVALRRPGRTV